MSSKNSSETAADCVELIITAAEAGWLTAFTQRLVADRLAACVQQWATPVQSSFRWDGEIQQETEFRAAVHTRADLVPSIVARADAKHPYDVPCVIATTLTAGSPAYLDWVRTETANPSTVNP